MTQVMMGHVSLSGQNMRVQDQIIRKAREPALPIDPSYMMPLAHYYTAAAGYVQLVDGVSPQVAEAIKIIDGNPDNKQQMTNVVAFSMDKAHPEKTLNEKALLAFKLIEEFSEASGYVLSTCIDKKRNLYRDENNELAEKQEKEYGPQVNEDYLLVCDYGSEARGSFIAFLMEKNYLTEKQISDIPGFSLGHYIHSVPAARKKMNALKTA